MKVVLVTEGKADIGFGHITRCLSLYQAFEEHNDVELSFVVNGDKTTQELLEGTRNHVINWLTDEHAIQVIQDSDVVIIDSYLAQQTHYKKLTQHARLAVFIDDNNRIDYPAGVIVNGTLFAENFPYLYTTNKKYLLGSLYTPLRKEFWEVPRKIINPHIRTILITFGGDDIRNMTNSLLKQIYNENVQIFVVVGKAFANTGYIHQKRHNVNFIFNASAKTMKQLMVKADIAFSAAGQTLYELARVGTPTVAVAVAENQMNNVKAWQQTGFICYAGWWSEADILNKIHHCYQYFQKIQTRKKSSAIGQHIIDGKGSRRIVQYIIRAFNNI